jgi:Response regulator receiver domain
MNAAVLPDAFLSYTRIDDKFWRGSITAFREGLELGVQVATGRANFSIFQDVDGTGIGQQYQKLFDQVIANALIFIPIITPLFFNSDACRGELQKFLDHEKRLGRDDLILPIYYVTAPVLEKSELRDKDPLASEIQKRQRYDWRNQTKLKIDDPAMQSALLELAQKIATTIGRTQTTPGRPSADNVEEVSTGVRLNEKMTVSAIRGAASISLERTGAALAPACKTILWVDDNPDYNVTERRAMEAYNIKFDLALSTNQALKKLKDSHFDAIISDMRRPGDPQAGYTLLQLIRGNKDRTPYFILSSAGGARVRREAEKRGAQGSTNRSDELIFDVLTCLQTSNAA